MHGDLVDYDMLQGFVQCFSQIFRVKDYFVVLIKLTGSRDCFCSPKTHHILIRWNEQREDAACREARARFLKGCSLHRWIRASGLLKHKIYPCQSRERIVWLFQPLVSIVELIDRPECWKSCTNSPCVSRPLGMLSVFHAFVLSVHCRGRVLELTTADPALHSSHCTAKDAVYWCLSSHLLQVDSLFRGSQLVLNNFWYVPINNRAHTSVNYEAILILGIYSTCQLTRTGNHGTVQATLDPCLSRCCTDSRLFAAESFYPINVRAILTLCLTAQSSSCSPTENSKNDTDSTLEHFKNSVLDRIVSPDPLYQPQLTEEFINFPFLYENSLRSCSPDCCALVVSHWLNAFGAPTSDTTTCELRLELPAYPSFSICTQRTIWRPRELIDRGHWSWCFEDTVARFAITDSVNSSSWRIKSLRILPETTKYAMSFGPVAQPLLIAQLCWNAEEACYYLIDVPLSIISPLLPMAYSESAFSSQAVSIPLVLKRSPVHTNSKPLPCDQTIVALMGAMLIYESLQNAGDTPTCDSVQDIPSLYITADQLIAMEPDSSASVLARFETLSVQNSISRDSIRLTRVGTASRTILPDARRIRRWCFPISGVSTTESNSTPRSFLLTGSLARRWYLALERDVTYSFCRRSPENLSCQHLISVKQIRRENSLKCDHLLSPQDALALGQSTLSCTVSTVHVQGLLFHKTQTAQDWCLWCGGEVSWDLPSTPATVGVSEGRIAHVVHIHIPFELDWTQWFMGFPGPMTWIRCYDLHWVRSGIASDSMQLVASVLSRIELIPPQSIGVDLPFCEWLPIRRLDQRNCAKCYALWTLTREEVGSPGWIGVSVLCPNNPTDSNVPVRHTSIRACIIKCLEFRCYRSDPVTLLKSTDGSSGSNLCFYMRFLISDGSGCALVQLGKSPLAQRCPPVSESLPTLAQTNSSIFNDVDLVRRLLGIDLVNWRRLCLVLVREMSRGVHKATHFSVQLKPVGLRDRQDSLSALQDALRTLLTSPTFYRLHTFLLERVDSPWKPLSSFWRLRQTRIQGTRADGSPCESALISFAVSPPQFFTLLNLKPAF